MIMYCLATLELRVKFLIKQYYVFFGIKTQVITYVKARRSFNKNKPKNCKPSGLLMPLQILFTHYKFSIFNFINDLLPKNVSNFIVVFVYRRHKEIAVEITCR